MKIKILFVVFATMLTCFPKDNFSQAPPDLGAASSFALFTAAGAFDVLGESTVVTGDVGNNVGAFTGFPPGVLHGDIHMADEVTAQAALDVQTAYAYLAGITCGLVSGTTLGGGQILTPNVYCLGAASTLNGDLTLDAQNDPDALFIFQIDGAFATSALSNVFLINSPNLCYVYWQINGEVSLGEGSTFWGTIINTGAVHLLEGSSLQGRVLSNAGAIDLHNNIVTSGLQPEISVISADGPTTFCEGGSVILSGNNGGTWSTGATTPSITVSVSGDYFVSDTTICCIEISNHIIVTVNPLPVASVISPDGPTTFCEGEEVILSGNVGGTWSTGVTTPTITVSAAGDYFVTNTNSCGSVNSNHIIVTVNPLPVASVISPDGPTTFCEGEEVMLSGNVGGTWSTGAVTPSITVSAAGDYFVTNTNSCGSVNSNHIIVTVNPLPVASVISADGPTTICADESVILSGNVGGTWSTGAVTPSITVSAAGDYFVTNTNSCGSVNSNHIIVIVNPLPVASVISADGPTTLCEGDEVTLSGNVGGIWNTGATTPSITVSTADDYFVTNTNSCGSVNSNHIMVNIALLPVASVIYGPTTLCEGDNIILSGNVGGIWSTGATTPTITVSSAGDYFVTNYSSCGSVNSNHIIVTVDLLPVASVISPDGPTTFCDVDSVILSGNIGGIWSNGAGTSSITVKTTGEYYVTNTNDCGSITSNHINVIANDCGNAAAVPISTWALVLGGVMIATFVFIRYRRTV